MKLRREPQGLHFYDRVSGLHVLFDEHPLSEKETDRGPRVISMALTNACDLRCSFCYAPKTRDHLTPAEVLGWCKEFAAMGTLEVAFGGGEPTLYKGLSQLCRAIWDETDLGISITTHGRHLTEEIATELEGKISIIRISIDAPEPRYSAIRGTSLQLVLTNIRRLAGRIPVGINTVVNSATMQSLDAVAEIVAGVSAVDWLLLPQVERGQFVLTPSEWGYFDEWLNTKWRAMNIRLTADAARFLSIPVLPTDDSLPYVHITADRRLKTCSYAGDGLPLNGIGIREALEKIAGSCGTSNLTNSVVAAP